MCDLGWSQPFMLGVIAQTTGAAEMPTTVSGCEDAHVAQVTVSGTQG